jgi:hypothetical protein
MASAKNIQFQKAEVLQIFKVCLFFINIAPFGYSTNTIGGFWKKSKLDTNDEIMI